MRIGAAGGDGVAILGKWFCGRTGTPELELLPTESMDIPADEALPAEGEDVSAPAPSHSIRPL